MKPLKERLNNWIGIAQLMSVWVLINLAIVLLFPINGMAIAGVLCGLVGAMFGVGGFFILPISTGILLGLINEVWRLIFSFPLFL